MSELNPNESKSMNTGSSNNGAFNSILALSAAVALLIGLIAGYFFGELRTTAKYEDLIERGVYNTGGTPVTPDNNGSGNNGENTNEIWDNIDYTKFKINDKTTVQDYYSDNETRYYASNIIGTTLPVMEWTDSEGNAHTTSEYSTGKYIVELFSSTCQYCNSSAAEVDEFREKTGNTVISLCLDDGDIDNFNQAGEHAWTLGNQNDSGMSELLANVPWIPCFLYIEDNTVQLVTYGGTTYEQMQAEWNTAFGE